MAQKELINLLLDIQKKVRDSSEIYRHFESDKRAHFITLIEQQVMADVRKAVAKAMNRKFKDVPTHIKQAITAGSKDMFDNYVEALRPENFLSKQKIYETSDYEVSGRRGSRTLTVVFATKQGKNAKGPFSAFKSIKQAAQKEFKNELNTLLKGAGVGMREVTSKSGNTRLLEPIDKNDFLDIGHMGNSAVQRQRVAEARNMLVDGFESSANSVVRNYIKQLRGSLQFVLQRMPRPEKGGKEVSEVGLELSEDNRRAADIPEVYQQLENDIENAILAVVLDFAMEGASPSFVDTVEQDVINQFAKMPGRKVGLKKKSTKRKPRDAETKPKVPGAAVGQALKEATKTGPVQSGKREQRKQSPINLMTLINSKLPQTVRKNMGFPALENRTGRFASSPRVLDVSQTPAGFPSVGYTYERQPYGVFEASSGSRFADPDRDPRTLIDKSIREIAAEMVTGRLYTRRI